LDFDTTTSGRRDGSTTTQDVGRSSEAGPEDGTFRIPLASKKGALVNLALEAWRAGMLHPKSLGQVRGREVDENGLRKALYRSSTGEIEHSLRPILKERKVVVEGRLPGTGRTVLTRLGAEVEEQRPEDEEHYIDVTPVIFVIAAVVMAIRFVSLGLDDESLYILSGIGFAVFYGLRPFISKLMRPKD
jgi:hypothetical protein